MSTHEGKKGLFIEKNPIWDQFRSNQTSPGSEFDKKKPVLYNEVKILTGWSILTLEFIKRECLWYSTSTNLNDDFKAKNCKSKRCTKNYFKDILYLLIFSMKNNVVKL